MVHTLIYFAAPMVLVVCVFFFVHACRNRRGKTHRIELMVSGVLAIAALWFCGVGLLIVYPAIETPNWAGDWIPMIAIAAFVVWFHRFLSRVYYRKYPDDMHLQRLNFWSMLL